ncbi:MAG: hypothetical protein MUC95_01155, partial [Spirochaetes bacterium]|nr:hypothetical protein [Spirochaetota bacterium]
KKLAEAFLEDARKYSEHDGLGSLHIDFGKDGSKHAVYEDAARSLYTVKNGAFKEEKEWRIFMFKNVKFIER